MSRIRALKRLLHPVSAEKKRLLSDRWQELPPSLRVGWQAVGQQITHCGFTLGASYCSFGCTHCYLPRNANRVPAPTLNEMKRQIDSNRSSLGDWGALQVTGGDVLDAYWREGRSEELVEILRYATDSGLVPMLMTHGQLLLDQPQYFSRLVEVGGLRRLAVHIDMTQAGRPGYPIRSVESEADLNPLRDQFVECFEAVMQRTGKRLTVAHTVTVGETNLSSIHEIVHWLRKDVRNARAFGMLSFQTEAEVGRTRMSHTPVTSDEVWLRLAEAFDTDLPSGSLWFGDPECSSMVSLALEFKQDPGSTGRSSGSVCSDSDGGLARVFSLVGDDEASRDFLTGLLATFGGVGSRGNNPWDANFRRLVLLARRPGFLFECVRYARVLLRKQRLGRSFWSNVLKKRVVAINLVQHNFMDEEQVLGGGEAVERRLAACSFRGAVERGGAWVDVPMCSLNSSEREKLYDLKIQAVGENGRTPERPAALSSP